MTPPYRDSHGKSLDDYPGPSVAVDTAVLTVADGSLAVLLVHADAGRTSSAAHPTPPRPADWLLPGTFIHPGETLRAAALRALREKAGVRGLAPQQLRVFDDPKRDDRGWVLSVAHFDVVRVERLLPAVVGGAPGAGSGRRAAAGAAHPQVTNARLVPTAAVPRMRFDHGEIVVAAVAAVRAEYRAAPDPRGLLGPDPFTIRELRLLHLAVTGDRVNADTFRRTMLPGLVPTGELQRGARGKPAELYRRG